MMTYLNYVWPVADHQAVSPTGLCCSACGFSRVMCSAQRSGMNRLLSSLSWRFWFHLVTVNFISLHLRFALQLFSVFTYCVIVRIIWGIFRYRICWSQISYPAQWITSLSNIHVVVYRPGFPVCCHRAAPLCIVWTNNWI